MYTWWLILPAFVILDLLFGDPEKLFHPIRWMGKAIEIFEPVFRKRIKGEQLAGTLFVVALVSGTWIITFGILSFANRFSPEFAIVIEVLILFYTLSIHSLILSGMTVYAHLKNGHIEKARIAVSMIVGRDTKQLDKNGLIRATVETLGENFVDGIVSPLFFAAIGGAPLAMAFKMISTLDSMTGYKNDKYRHFGSTAARLDDIVNWIPARLSLLFIGIGARFSGFSNDNAWITALNEGSHHPSPNAGYPEAAFAGALGVRLNGPSVYQGRIINKPYIGKVFQQPNVVHILQACTLVFMSSMISVLFVWCLGMIVDKI
jgi:adenosylcobinamide-phosphate synthase